MSVESIYRKQSCPSWLQDRTQSLESMQYVNVAAGGLRIGRWLMIGLGGSAAVSLISSEGGLTIKAAYGEQGHASPVQHLKGWLEDLGADMSLLEVKESKLGSGAGLGLFVSQDATAKLLRACSQAGRRHWWWPFGTGGMQGEQQRALASFPLTAAITAANILRDPRLGEGYAWMLNRGLVDERTIIVAHLVVERLRGAASELSPWIDALPRR